MEKILYREGFTAEELPNEVTERIKGVSYKENPYVKLGDLAYLRVRYYDFEHKVQSGELIVARKLAQEVLDLFYYAKSFDPADAVSEAADPAKAVAESSSTAKPSPIAAGVQMSKEQFQAILEMA